MYTIKSKTKVICVLHGELIALPLFLGVKPFKTESKSKAISVWQAFGGEFSEYKVVKE